MRHVQRENDLRQALRTSRTIGKAIGVVMERSDLDDEEAFAYLARLEQIAGLASTAREKAPPRKT